MSRTPIRDRSRHRPATPTTVARTTTAQGGKSNVALGLVPSQKQASGQPVARFSSSYVAFTRPYVIPAEAGIHRRRGQRNHSSYSKSLRMLYRPAVHHIQVSVFYLITPSVSALRGRVRRTERPIISPRLTLVMRSRRVRARDYSTGI